MSNDGSENSGSAGSGSAPRRAGADAWLAAALLDALPDAVAVVDATGTIVAVNHAWSMYALDNGGDAAATGVGVNYLQVCSRAAEAGSRDAGQVATALVAVLSGATAEYALGYACPSPAVGRWYHLRITPIAGPQPGALVAHVDVTRTRRLELALTAQSPAATVTPARTAPAPTEPGQPEPGQPEPAPTEPGRTVPRQTKPWQTVPRQTTLDPLTGLASRSAFEQHLEEALRTPAPPDAGPGVDVGVILVDLDAFGRVNQTYGRAAGDSVLQTVAYRLTRATRPQQTVARLDDDAFAVLAPRITYTALTVLGDELREVLERPHLVHGQWLEIGAALGPYLARAGDTAPYALSRADEALFRAQRERRQALTRR